ncbi:exodeoxyribonuclease V subunit alpha [Desulforegula conservatrix]|uniref:exodeoxyribonuclease V subunit alpha n=1 Tax=Desulforegula conservatrix TaxID=153026 RepID=UPI0003F6739A|nr:exodeoxyribonuclease V subunit alpha [Desulforegula conservatrix]
MFEKIPNILNKSKSDSVFSASDKIFSAFLCRLTVDYSDESALAYAIASSQTGKGHICIDLDSEPLSDLLREMKITDFTPEQIRSGVEKSKAVGNPDESYPLLLAGNRFLYLKKFWDYQNIIENFINSKDQSFFEIRKELIEELVTKNFDNNSKDYNWQMGAAICAARSRFCLVTGGPGTGKTTTAAKIISILTEILKPELKRKPKIILAAPTGKAAARISSAISSAMLKIKNLGVDDTDAPEAAITIHRLLGIGHASSRPRYNNKNPLIADVLIIDEASMVDIAMMANIMDALPKRARLILMGDKDQLSSVEPGAVLADICKAGPADKFSQKAFSFLGIGGKFPNISPVEDEGFYDGVVELDKSYRFSGNSGIGLLAEAIKNGDKNSAFEILKSKLYTDIVWIKRGNENSLKKIINDLTSDHLSRISASDSPEKALDCIDEFKILCAVRQGIWGVEGINSTVRELMHENKYAPADGDWYHGRPVMITTNDYQLGLFNGDTGIALKDDNDKKNLMVYFRSGDNTVKAFHPSRLGRHETVFASTVHKSQGSEYDRVALVLPDRFTGALSMELVYTAVTRAKKEFILISSEEIFSMAISERTRRTSGLCNRLLGLI